MLIKKWDINDFAWPVFVIFLLTKAFAGPLAMIVPLIRFIPIAFMVLLISYKSINVITSNAKMLMIAALMFLYIIIGMINKSLFAALFGFYIFIPFIFSFLFCNELIDKIVNHNVKFNLILLSTCAIGVLYVNQFGGAWIGMEQEVGGVTKQISKAWSSDGVIRNPGFTSGSVSAAGIMLITTALLGRKLLLKGNYLLYFFLFVFSFYIIYLTTTKTMIISLLLVMILLLSPYNIMRWAVKLSIVLMILFSYFFMFGDKPIGLMQYENTLLIRMYATWPNAIGILDSNISLLFGKGFGSIGTPSYFFFSKFASPADNMFVYLYVIFGLFSVVLVLMQLIPFIIARKFNTIDDKLYLALVFIILNGAVTYNFIESSVYAIYGGMLSGYIILQKNKERM